MTPAASPASFSSTLFLMDPSLVNALADRLGTSTMEARIALADLLQDVREELEHHGAVQLPGLGTFRRESRPFSRLTFQPDALLADAANHVFAGLDALTVPDPSAETDVQDTTPAAQSEPAQPEPLSEHAASPPPAEAQLTEPPAASETAEPLVEPPSEKPKEHTPAETGPVEPPLGVPSAGVPSADEALPDAAKRYESSPPESDTEPAQDEPAPPARPAPELPTPLPIRKVDWESVLQDTPYAVMPAAGYLHGGPTRTDLEAATLETPTLEPPPTDFSSGRTPDCRPAARSSTRRRVPALLWISAALVLAALAAGLWYVMQPGERAEPLPPPSAEREPAPATSPGPASTSDTAAAPPAEEEPAAEELAEEPLAPVLEPTPGDWTAVAASRPTRAEADVLARQYRVQLGASGVPVGVLAGEVDGDQLFRVAVGRFSSFEETQTFLQRAGSPLPADAWALQIEP